MIATRNYLPLLQDQYGEVSAIETDWLLNALERAARKAGFDEWWLADHVTSSVCTYLGGVYTKNVVGLGRLQKAVKKVLQDIGYEEIARYFQADSPSVRVSLLHCAQSHSPTDFEAFYKVLSTQIFELHQNRAPRFHFNDLCACSLYFKDADGERNAPQARDIVDFIRGKIASLDWGRVVNCSIS